MSKIVAKREELAAKQDRLAKTFAECKQDDGTLDFMKSDYLEGSDMAARRENFHAKTAELEALATEIKQLKEDDAAAAKVAAMGDDLERAAGRHMHAKGGAHGNPAEPFVFGASGMKALLDKDGRVIKGREVSFAIPEVTDGSAVKTLFQTTAGWAPETIRTGRLVESAQRPVQVIDLIPGNTTNQSAVVYMLESTFTNNAAEAAEGAVYGESALAYTETSSPVQKIAVSLPVTDEQLEDVSQVQGILNNRLTFMLKQRLDGQIIWGNGTSPNLSGITDRSGIQTQAKGADSVPDAVHKAITKVRAVAFANPDAIVMHSNDWQAVRLLTTADGIYLWGSPSEAGPPMMWGLPVVLHDHSSTENTAIVGDYRTHSQLSIRRNVTLKITDSHSTDFVYGKQMIRADMRCSLEVFREAAFCTVTGI